jgi:LPXTG-site transpeptidase (sortase) family protein
MNDHSKIFNKKILARVLILFGIIGLLVSISAFFGGPTPRDLPLGLSLSVNPSNEKPSAEELAAFTVSAESPRYIEIPAIHVGQTRVLTEGILPNKQIATPDNTNDTGWYKDSGKPGQDGVMFIFGHVSSRSNNGIFHNLNHLQVGDKIIITRGDGFTYNYLVESLKTYPAQKVDMNAVLTPINPNRAGLNLMTCDGVPVKDTNSFSERLVVFTSQI